MDLTFVLLFLCVSSARTRTFAKNDPHTALAKKLFRGYEPLPPPGGPTVVRIGIYVNYFYGISEQSMDYRLSFYLRREWMDSRFAFDSSKHQNITKLKLDDSKFRRLWVPDVFFRNEKGAAFHLVTQNNRLVYIYEDGRIWYVSKITATFSCPMSLHKYPMDRQSCPLKFESFGYTTDTIVYEWLPDGVQFDITGQNLPEMVKEDHEMNDCSYTIDSGYQSGTFPCLEAQFIVSRPLGYYMIQFYIPSILLVILSWLSFWISADAVVARVSLGLLTVLNLVTQSTGSRNQLPKVSYIKAIDVWMTVCLVFAFASLIEFALVNVWSRMEAREKKINQKSATGGKEPGQQQQQQQLSLGSKCREEIQLKQASLQVSPSQHPGQKGGRRIRRLSDLSNIAAQPLLSIHQLRAQTLDQLSRKLFPCSFVVFNLIYWITYLKIIN